MFFYENKSYKKRKKILDKSFKKEKEAYEFAQKYKSYNEERKKRVSDALFSSIFLIFMSIIPLLVVSSVIGTDFSELFFVAAIIILIITITLKTESANGEQIREPTENEIELSKTYSREISKLQLDIAEEIKIENQKLENYIEGEIDRIDTCCKNIEKLNEELRKLNIREKQSFRSSLTHLKKMNPYDFEEYVGNIYENLGFAIKQTPKSGDEGVDLVLEKQNQYHIVQCKRYDGTVSSSEIRAFLGTLTYHKIEAGKFVTTGRFSSPCYEFERKYNIELVEGNDLMKMARKVLKTSDTYDEIQKERELLKKQIHSLRKQFLDNICPPGTSDHISECENYIDKLLDNKGNARRYISPFTIRSKVRKILGA